MYILPRSCISRHFNFQVRYALNVKTPHLGSAIWVSALNGLLLGFLKQKTVLVARSSQRNSLGPASPHETVVTSSVYLVARNAFSIRRTSSQGDPCSPGFPEPRDCALARSISW
jgi:hypothetical protein